MSDVHAMSSSFSIHLSRYTLIFIACHDFGHFFRDREYKILWCNLVDHYRVRSNLLKKNEFILSYLRLFRGPVHFLMLEFDGHQILYI